MTYTPTTTTDGLLESIDLTDSVVDELMSRGGGG